jgi:hypothetical protein
MQALALVIAALLGSPTPSVTVAGDSVIVVVALADNAVPQAAGVDVVEFYADIAGGGTANIRKVVVAKAAGVTTGRLAWPLSAWTANQTRGGQIGARLGNTEGVVTAWSDWTFSAAGAWSYTREVPAPAAPEVDKVTLQSAGLN